MRYEDAGVFDLSRCGVSFTTVQVTAAANEITHTMKNARPMSPRTVSIDRLRIARCRAPA